MTSRHALRIHIGGVVQGVGFRPFIYSQAVEAGLKGWVRNTSAGVDIQVEGAPEKVEAFLASVREAPPPLARIHTFEFEACQPDGFEGFEILASRAQPGEFQPISPDVSLCDDCRRELFDPGDRRFRYAFINCTNCGPRFTIITDIPYDRPNTTMADFELCPACSTEYQDPLDRRFHAQPVACPACGPQVWLEADGERLAEGEAAIQATRDYLRQGRIVAMKGLGGFHLACDASQVGAVETLRQRKLRVDKPFAVMVADLEMARQHAELMEGEAALLASRERPIVLLRRSVGSTIAAAVAPQQDRIGLMLPYTPLHALILEPEQGFPTALVMTSGNICEEPIAIDNQEAAGRLASLADAFLMHDRDIRTRCDDSVVQAFEGEVYPLRRSRGFAPYPIRLPWESLPILAGGAELKNTFCLTQGRNAFLSHHIGDLENYETLTSLEDGIQHFERLFRIQPGLLAYDLHPNTLATRYIQQRAEREGLPAVGVQHHQAHIAACMADNGLAADGRVIGFSFDGTGYGEDGAIWGGEVFVGGYAGFERVAHLDYVPLPGGDAAIRAPWRTALAWLWKLGLEWMPELAPVAGSSEPERQILLGQLESGLNTPPTSSMGRLFDAVAALIGVRQTVNYEAQAAMELEALVAPSESSVYSMSIRGERIDPSDTIAAIVEDLGQGIALDRIAARFHNTVAALVVDLCDRLRDTTGLHTVALSGGVWQNRVLLERSVSALRAKGFTVLIHRQVPTNDGGISLGQAAIASVREMIGSNRKGELL
ncbi:MAG: carbamoyltransferase HypF [Anaerolineales bacterium]|nr:MAG: carbamoyltransferase HypF [Anaerolineales bacterium]